MDTPKPILFGSSDGTLCVTGSGTGMNQNAAHRGGVWGAAVSTKALLPRGRVRDDLGCEHPGHVPIFICWFVSALALGTSGDWQETSCVSSVEAWEGFRDSTSGVIPLRGKANAGFGIVPGDNRAKLLLQPPPTSEANIPKPPQNPAPI